MVMKKTPKTHVCTLWSSALIKQWRYIFILIQISQPGDRKRRWFDGLRSGGVKTNTNAHGRDTRDMDTNSDSGVNSGTDSVSDTENNKNVDIY